MHNSTRWHIHILRLLIHPYQTKHINTQYYYIFHFKCIEVSTPTTTSTFAAILSIIRTKQNKKRNQRCSIPYVNNSANVTKRKDNNRHTQKTYICAQRTYSKMWHKIAIVTSATVFSWTGDRDDDDYDHKNNDDVRYHRLHVTSHSAEGWWSAERVTNAAITIIVVVVATAYYPAGWL